MGAGRGRLEPVGEGLSWWDQTLSDVGSTIHPRGPLLVHTMPMDGGALCFHVVSHVDNNL